MNSSFYVDIENIAAQQQRKQHSVIALFELNHFDYSAPQRRRGCVAFTMKIESDQKWTRIMRFHCLQMFDICYPFWASFARSNGQSFWLCHCCVCSARSKTRNIFITIIVLFAAMNWLYNPIFVLCAKGLRMRLHSLLATIFLSATLPS